jgi:hypothetical protein
VQASDAELQLTVISQVGSMLRLDF